MISTGSTVSQQVMGDDNNLPLIRPQDTLEKVFTKLSIFFVDEIKIPFTFEQLRTTFAGDKIRRLEDELVLTCHNPVIINALFILEPSGNGINGTRANACQLVAWRFLCRISERDAVDFCLYELPAGTCSEHTDSFDLESSERSFFLPKLSSREVDSTYKADSDGTENLRKLSVARTKQLQIFKESGKKPPIPSFPGLNGLEIAVVADCKRFLSQKIVQKIVTGIWKGDIIFWESLNTNVKKTPNFYNPKRHPDIFTRLRVPRYIKFIEVLFFVTFLLLCYGVLLERNFVRITPLESLLYIWFFAFAYDELGEFIDAGSIFYVVDIWNGCDLIIIFIGIAFILIRTLGILRNDHFIVDIAFDVLSLEALFMVPRACSLLSLYPYFGILIPCLKEMTKEFIKFMVVVAVFYVGFLTTFTLIANESFNLHSIALLLIKIILGSGFLGFEVMEEINPIIGPPLMITFVCMTDILLLTSLISILSESFSKVQSQAREEHLFVYSVYVLEAASSNRLTRFYPPLNIIPLIFIYPLCFFMDENQLRGVRISILKLVHLPFVGIIWIYERLYNQGKGHRSKFSPVSMGAPHYTGLKFPKIKKLPKTKTYSKQAGRHSSQDSNSDCSGNQNSKSSSESSIVTRHEDPEVKAQIKELSHKIEQLITLVKKSEKI